MEKFISVSGPRCAGKETLLKYIETCQYNLPRIIPFTTRPKRPGETEGKELMFIQKNDFFSLQKNSEILYFVQIGEESDPSHYYSGTLKEEFDRHTIGIIDITVVGARILEKYAKKSLKLFVFAHEHERIARVMDRQKISYAEATIFLSKEPSPAIAESLEQDYKDFKIIRNHDGFEKRAFSQAGVCIEEFLV